VYVRVSACECVRGGEGCGAKNGTDENCKKSVCMKMKKGNFALRNWGVCNDF
jgi:hypothetical protein